MLRVPTVQASPSRRRHRRPAAAALLAVVVTAGCGGGVDGDPTPAAPASPAVAPSPSGSPGPNRSGLPTPPPSDASEVSQADDAAAALVVCTHLVDTQTQLEVIANDALEGISLAAPDERAGPLAAGYDRAIARVQELMATVDELELPDIPERRQILDELAAGLDAAVVELEDERADFEDGPIEDAEVFGMAGRYLNGYEKTVASMETALEDYPRRQLQEAFMAERTCEFVVQPVRLDD